MTPYLASAQIIQDVRRGLPEGADLGDLEFAATAPIDTLCGQHLGVLVIADRVARPEFSAQDLHILVQMAAVMADRIEMRMIASQAAESGMRYDEAEERFEAIANDAHLLIACNEADGSCQFVNDSWLKFTGRNCQSELGEGWQQLVHPRHLPTVLNLSMQARQPFPLELPLLRHDGVFRWLRGKGTPRLLKDGTYSGFTVRLTDESDYIEDVADSAQIRRCPMECHPRDVLALDNDASGVHKFRIIE